MKFFEASFVTVMIRYYMLMAVVIIAFLVNVPWLAFLALPIFLTAFMAINFRSEINRISSDEFRMGDADKKDKFSAKAA